MSLKVYHKKRNFKVTKEPKGKIKSATKKKRYLIQKHAASHLHYDLRLELNGVLKSWAVPKGPCLDPSIKRLAVHVEDHPMQYGSFEGEIPKGQYGGGTVMLWDQGEWIPSSSDPDKDYKKGNIKFTIKGKKLKGDWKLIRIKSDEKNWLLIKTNDKYAKNINEYDILEKRQKSIKSNKTMKQLSYQPIKKKKKINNEIIHLSFIGKKSSMPNKVTPQLATLVDKPPEGDEWLHEIKFDGYRLIAFIKNKKIRLMTRRNHDWTDKFPNIVKSLKKLNLKNAILDGEVVVLDENQHSNFELLQTALKNNENSLFTYYIFDLLYLDQYDLNKVLLIKRKEILKKIILNNDNTLRYSDHIISSGIDVFNKSCKLGLEGIISKNINSAYIQKRSTHWLKIKCTKRQEFVIAGFTQPKNSRTYFGALVLGVYNKNKKLIYCGRVGTGFNAKSLKTIYAQLSKLITKTRPFKSIPPESSNIIWVKPKLIAEVEFIEWTSDHILRHPSFKGLRMDKKPRSVVLEKEKPLKSMKSTIHLSHPDKILYPKLGITKQDLYDYYDSIQKWILPHVSNRPLTLLRCPNGAGKTCFYQKHVNDSSLDYLKPITIKEKNKKDIYIYVDHIEGILQLAQLGVLEIHTWGSHIKNIEKPDRVVFDIDPGPNVKWHKVVEAAFEIKKQLQEFKLKSFVNTTGGKGLHIVVPIIPEYKWPDIKIFAKVFVEYLVQKYPDKYVSKMTKSKRIGKIFIDYLRNQRGATFIAPYSTRSNADATVATPIDWNELTANIKDTTYNIKTITKRLKNLKQDPWRDIFKIKQSLNLDKL